MSAILIVDFLSNIRFQEEVAPTFAATIHFFHLLHVRGKFFTQKANSLEKDKMSTFRREVTEPLEALEESLESMLAAGEVEVLRAQLESIKETAESFVKRANKPDSPFGAQMKARVQSSWDSIERLEKRLEEAHQQQEMKDPVTPSLKKVEEEPIATPTSAAAATSTNNKSNEKASTDEDDATKRRAEALQKIKEKEARIEAEIKSRQVVAAEEEKKRRDEYRAKQEEELARMRREKEKQQSALLQHVALGQVNHVHSTEDYHNKLAAAGNRVCVVKWGADWCGPCRMMEPKLAQIAAQYHEGVFLSVNTDENKQLSSSMGIRSLPTFQIRVNGSIMNTIMGANEAGLRQAVAQASQLAEESLMNEAMLLSSMDDGGIAKTSKAAAPQRLSLKLHKSVHRMLARMDVDSETPVGEFLGRVVSVASSKGESGDVNDFVILAGGITLDQRREKQTLANVGVLDQSVVFVLNKASPMKVNLIDPTNQKNTFITIRPSSILKLLQREARVFTKTQDPKLIFAGKVLNQSKKSLKSLGITNECAIQCLPGAVPMDEAYHSEEEEEEVLQTMAVEKVSKPNQQSPSPVKEKEVPQETQNPNLGTRRAQKETQEEKTTSTNTSLKNKVPRLTFPFAGNEFIAGAEEAFRQAIQEEGNHDAPPSSSNASKQDLEKYLEKLRQM